MVQLNLDETPVPRPQRWLRVVEDYGAIGKGFSAARYVLAENGQEYIIKGPSLLPPDRPHPYVAANELITAKMAQLLGLSVLGYTVVEWDGELFFASDYMKASSYYAFITKELLESCLNRDLVYELVAFDTWLCNIDRHQENLVVRRRRTRRGPDQRLLLLNDHSHCLMVPGLTPARLYELLGTTPAQYLRLDFVRDAIIDPTRLREAIDAIRLMEDGRIRAELQGVPEAFLPRDERPLVEEFLLKRKAGLLAVFKAATWDFPNLQGGVIP